MKYVVLLGDGMSDRPIKELGGKTPLQAACIPHMDMIASKGITGLVKTIPDGMPPGSDVANLSVFGYDPAKYYTGRSPLEAASLGVKLEPTDMVFRCNLVTLSPDNNFENRVMLDYSAGEISTGESHQLIESIKDVFCSDVFELYAGVSYRHCLVWRNGPDRFLPSPLIPPHDILDKPIASYLPHGENGSMLTDIMKKCCPVLENHPVNIERKNRGLNPGNSIWFWGEGRKPAIDSFPDKYGVFGSVIAAVDLIKGIGICAGLKPVNVAGATGTINTNYAGKVDAALAELKSGADFVYIHLEAPDECGHHGEIENKVKAIELIDNLVLNPLLKGLDEYDEYSILLLPDHPTPLEIRTHASDAVPFALYRKGRNIKPSGARGYSEIEAGKSGLFIREGHKLMDFFITH
jgi:2,3-bisphosphoglycerate-independent phosphoglycerate mutase